MARNSRLPQALLFRQGRRTLYLKHLLGLVSDVFAPEPLRAESPLWAHPKATVTSHNSAVTQPEDVAAAFADNLERFERGGVEARLPPQVGVRGRLAVEDLVEPLGQVEEQLHVPARRESEQGADEAPLSVCVEEATRPLQERPREERHHARSRTTIPTKPSHVTTLA